MIRRIFLPFLAAISIIALEVNALNVSDEVILDECQITPQVWQMISWPEIGQTNNLRRRVGHSGVAMGQNIIIDGRLVDSNCVPIVGAIVNIWQANIYGDMKNDRASNTYDANFLSTGAAVTDNLGRFQFITVFPGQIKGRAPFINFRVRHVDFDSIETVMFFENQTANDFDPILTNEVGSRERSLLISTFKEPGSEAEGLDAVYSFDIVLEGRNKYLRY